MIRMAVALVMLAFALAGCDASTGGNVSAGHEAPGGGDTRAPSGASSATPAGAAPSGSAPVAGTARTAPPATRAARPAPRAADGSNVRACFDGRCEIAVSKPVSFRVAPRLGVTRVSAEVTGEDVVKVKATGPGITLQVVIGPGAPGRLNDLDVRVREITDGTAVLEFSPAR